MTPDKAMLRFGAVKPNPNLLSTFFIFMPIALNLPVNMLKSFLVKTKIKFQFLNFPQSQKHPMAQFRISKQNNLIATNLLQMLVIVDDNVKKFLPQDVMFKHEGDIGPSGIPGIGEVMLVRYHCFGGGVVLDLFEGEVEYCLGLRITVEV